MQYFEPFLNLAKKGEIFADVGAFDGFTSEQFVKNCPDYTTIHVFEPVPPNMITAKQRLSSHNRIHYHDIGLSDQKGTVSFSADGSCSKSKETGELNIKIDRLDDLNLGTFSLIKMDIEGAELAALHGAQKTIKENKPRLAISVYHRPSDIWAIPRKLLSIHPDYNVCLRHYTESIYETVMFFLPQES
jgi:FkbM family methyltransferase